MKEKLKRSELLLILGCVALMVANRTLELGLTTADIYALFMGSGSYAVSRGVAKANKNEAVS